MVNQFKPDPRFFEAWPESGRFRSKQDKEAASPAPQAYRVYVEDDGGVADVVMRRLSTARLFHPDFGVGEIAGGVGLPEVAGGGFGAGAEVAVADFEPPADGAAPF